MHPNHFETCRNGIWYFLRHGETQMNREGRINGQIDEPLTKRGEQQALMATSVLKTLNIRTVVTSPMERARKTALLITDHCALEPIVIDDLRECHFGIWQGKKEGKFGERWRLGETPMDGESYGTFSQRVKRGLNLALNHSSPVLVVSHSAFRWVLADSIKIEVQPAAHCKPYKMCKCMM